MGAPKPKRLTDPGRFFLEPVQVRHRQYEALRAYFVEHRPSAEVARAFGYTSPSGRGWVRAGRSTGKRARSCVCVPPCGLTCHEDRHTPRDWQEVTRKMKNAIAALWFGAASLFGSVAIASPCTGDFELSTGPFRFNVHLDYHAGGVAGYMAQTAGTSWHNPLAYIHGHCDGNDLWFNRPITTGTQVYRARAVDGGWSGVLETPGFPVGHFTMTPR
jgi:hypothetical protein